MPPLSQITEGSSNISFICVANAKPQATIQWMKNGNLLSNSTTMIISSITMGNCSITDSPDQCMTSSTLRIFNTQPSDSGVYTCNATNEAGYVGENATLTVNGMHKCITASYIAHCSYRVTSCLAHKLQFKFCSRAKLLRYLKALELSLSVVVIKANLASIINLEKFHA